ncbi:MAG: serine hydrolase [Phenylobacterium sp.]|uniref:serine hydrolase domain-containing protein n=1 Tax=Phenylobacterium sp. TaxID=1871053 RepID=UPI0027237459|nr:serine hydrolase [Phenylobacterium sp.]MDO8410164.1 serine hydrolase [Phenylobacterium sp.]
MSHHLIRKTVLAGAVAAAGLVAAPALAPAHAQVPLDPATPNFLMWSPELQSRGYRAIEDVFQVNTIERGEAVRPLVMADRQIDPTFTHDGQDWTVASYMEAFNVSGVLVLKDGQILLERYGMGRQPADRWTSFSVAKSVTSTLVGAAIQDGKIAGLNAPVTDYIPELAGSAYDGVTVRQLLMMSSGVTWNEDYTDPKSDVANAGVAPGEPGMNAMVSYMRRLPRANPPGAVFNYNTGETDLVGLLVSNATGQSLAAYASEKIWKPYGMERDAIWMVDPTGQERGGCCISMTLRDYGRVGQFVLEGGMAGDRAVLPAGWVEAATTRQIDNGAAGYGYFWWMNPSGAYQASGIFGQSITTYRDDGLVIVINSAWPRATGADLSAARSAFLDAVHAAAKE